MRDIFAIVQDLKDPDWQTRRGAVKELQEAGDERAIPLFVRMLQDREARVRQAAAEALAEQGDLEAAVALAEALADRDDYVRYYAVIGLGRLRYEEAVPLLVKRLRDPLPYVREQAARALAELAEQVTEPAVRHLMEKGLLHMLQKDWLLDNRRAAAQALGRLGAEEKLLELALGEDLDQARYADEELRRQHQVTGREPARVNDELGMMNDEREVAVPEISGLEPATGEGMAPGQNGREPMLGGDETDERQSGG